MTEHIPSDPFDEIVGNLQHEMLDPVVEPFFQRVHDYVTKIDGKQISQKDAKAIHSELNKLLSEVDPTARDIYVRVSGKVRLLPGADLSVLTNSRLTTHLHALQPGITEKFDGDGSYYPVHRQLAILDDIVVEPVGEWTNGSAPHRISYRLSLSEQDFDEYADYDQEDMDDESDELNNSIVDIIIYGNELTSLERADTSREELVRDLRRYFPEIAAQLDAVPNEFYDDMDAIRAVKELELEFDWSKTPYHDPEERQAIVDTVSNILIEKLGLDSSMYQITYQGLVGGMQPDGIAIRQVQSERRTLNGIIVGTVLEKYEDSSIHDDVTVYYPAVFISAPAYGHDRGDMLITMPLASIMGLSNLRNGVIFTTPTSTHATMVAPRSMEFIASHEQPDSNDAGNESSADSNPSTEVLSQERMLVSQEQLEQCEKEFNKLWAYLRSYSEKTYTSYDEVKKVQAYLAGMMDNFIERNPNMKNRRVTFSGECVESISTSKPGTLIVERSPLRLELADNILHRGDMMTRRTGWFMGNMSVPIESNHDEENPEYKVRPYLFVVEEGMRGTIGSAPEEAVFGAALYQMRYEVMVSYAVNLVNDGQVEFTELTQLQNFNESVARLAKDVPDKTQLPAYLADVMHDIALEVPDKLVQIGADNLRAIGEEVQSDQIARHLTTEVLAAMFGKRDVVVIKGKIYDVDGEERATKLNGKLLTVIDTAPSGKLVGPMFVILHNDEIHYAPVSEVTSIHI